MVFTPHFITGIYNNLAIMNLNGLGTQKNPHAAFKFFEQAAQQGNSYAFYQIATMYEQGMISHNERIDTALVYYKKAAQAGNNLAKNAVKRIENYSLLPYSNLQTD